MDQIAPLRSGYKSGLEGLIVLVEGQNVPYKGERFDQHVAEIGDVEIGPIRINGAD